MKKWIGLGIALFLAFTSVSAFAKSPIHPVEPTKKIENKDARKGFDEGVKAFKNEKYGEAATHFEAALKADPNLPEAQINLGLALAEEGKTQEAKKAFDEAVNLISKGKTPTG